MERRMVVARRKVATLDASLPLHTAGDGVRWEDLAAELQLMVFKHLAVSSLAQCMRVCKAW